MSAKKIKIAPSMMCADFINLGRELDLMREAGIDYLHVDIMDGRYVPNFTLGPDFCRALAAYSPIPMDIHLMTENPDAHVPLFSGFPGAVVSFHPEAAWHPLRAIDSIRKCGGRAGIAIDPATPIESVRELLPHVSLACVMTVNPGYSGQTMIEGAIHRIHALADMVEAGGWDVEIEADGNVSWDNIPSMIEAGATMLVAGSSSLYEKNADLGANIRRLCTLIGRE